MYREILIPLWDDSYFQIVFSTIILLKRPLSVTGLECLLNFRENQILSELLKIQSVLLIPDDDEKAVDIVHTSLRDFSMLFQRSGILCVESSENHLRIAICCLQVMLRQSGQLVFETEAAKYACYYWIEHLHLTVKDTNSRYVRYDSLVEELEIFLRQSFQTWFNTISNTKGTDAIKGELNLLQTILSDIKVCLALVVANLH